MELGVDVKIAGDYEKSATGDVKLIDGLQNLKEAIYRRILTTPGEVVHRPNYGVGLKRYTNRPSNIYNQQELSNAIRLNVLNEQRIERVNSISCQWVDNIVHINISVVAYGRSVEFDYRVVKL